MVEKEYKDWAWIQGLRSNTMVEKEYKNWDGIQWLKIQD